MTVTIDVFLLGLMVISTLTSLTTQGIKKILNERNITYRSNALAGIIAIVLSAAIGAGYAVVTGIAFNAQTIICIVALMYMSWLCAMVGYDKIISQFKSIKGE